jgi:hypothetical protein
MITAIFQDSATLAAAIIGVWLMLYVIGVSIGRKGAFYVMEYIE